MVYRVRGKPVRFLSAFLVLLLCILWWHPVSVQAAKNTKIEQLYIVDNVSGGHVSKMETAVRDQALHAGDSAQHEWLTGLSDVGDAITQVENNPPNPDPSLSLEDNAGRFLAKTAVCLWVGEQYLHDFSDEFDNYFNHDCEGADSDSTFRSNGDYIGYNATGLARYICGYDYQYEVTVLDFLPDGSPDWETPPRYDADGHLIAAGVQKSHIEHRVGHVDGLATDIQNWSGRGVKLYAFALGPVTKEKTDDGNAIKDDLKVGGVSNEDIQNWNKTFSTVLKNFTWVDIYGDISDHNPYYSTGGNSGRWYDDQMYQWIFHLMWNTILTLNPNDTPPEPISMSFYDISSSLTSYMNMVLSPTASEDHADHLLKEADTSSVGNAGAFLGYGDKDFDFKSYVTGNLSKTSSVVDYNALLDVESGSGNSNALYLYSRYGMLLSDLGLDKTGTALTVGSPNLVQGGLLYALYVLTSSVNLIFMVVVGLLQGLNPFGFFKEASEIASGAKSGMGVGASLVKGVAGDQILGYIGEIYDGFYSIGFVLLMLSFVLVIAGILLVPRGYKDGLSSRSMWDRVRPWLFRAVFLFIGVPVLGILYTCVLDYMGTMYTNANANQTKIVGCTFVDFKDWAKTKRLSPFQSDSGNTSGTMLVSSPSTSQDGGSIGGIASDESYRNLRKTVAVINMGSGAVSGLDLSDEFGTDLTEYVDLNADRSNGSFFGNVSENADTFRDGLGLLRMYMFGDFYTAGNWESDTLAYVSKKYRSDDPDVDKIGRRAGLEEDDPPDNTGKLYELFDATNDASDWTGRSTDDNHAIFDRRSGIRPSDSIAKAWTDNRINVFDNGGLRTKDEGIRNNESVSDLNQADTVQYFGSPSGDGRDTGNVMGLSTISLYNYLSTSFDTGQMTVYSNERAPSVHTKRQHYSVNLVGSGMISVMYYLSCFALLFVVAILGVYYGCGILVSNIKNGFKLLLQIPVAMIGGVKAIVQVVLLVCMMIAEIIGTLFLYQMVSDVMMLFLTALEGPLANRVSSVGTAIGGFTGMVGQVGPLEAGNLVSFYGFVGCSSLLVILFAVCLVMHAKSFVRVWNTAREYVYLRYVLCPELRDVCLEDGVDTVSYGVSDVVRELIWI